MNISHWWLRGRKKLHKLIWVSNALGQKLFLKKSIIGDLQSALINGLSVESIPDIIRTRPSIRFFIYPSESDSIVKNFSDVFPDQLELIKSSADQVCLHNFDLLGSGLTHLGASIDWHSDFKTGYKFSSKELYFKIKPASYPGGFDIKIPWELNRCQHFICLGQAYWITGDEKYTEQFMEEVTDWIAANQWIQGVNWSCTMDVAIRAINWLWGLYFFIRSPLIEDSFILKFVYCLLLHGRFIFNNLERWPNHTTNHYLSNLAGLIYLGILLPEIKESRIWREFALKEMEKEITIQVYPDGMDFESSVYYHKFVTEIIMTSGLLAKINGFEFGGNFWARLEKMVEFIQEITRPDGTFPIIGDQDNGRIHRLKIWKENDSEWVDARYILAIGAYIFNRRDFGFAAGDQWEEAFWFFGIKAREAYDELKKIQNISDPPKSVRFPQAGIIILRDNDFHMTLNASPNGQSGNGGHAHNDKLSFTIQTRDQDWLIDPGTFVYTADYEARQQFRSTRSHNTICIDGQEQNRCSPNSIFSMEQDSFPRVLNWVTNEDYDLLDIIHFGYNRISGNPNHRRQIYLQKGSVPYCIIKDLLIGEGNHQVELNYHLGNVQINFVSPSNMILRSKIDRSKQFGIRILDNDMEFGVHSCWHSNSYGKKERQDCVRSIRQILFPSSLISLLFWGASIEFLKIDESEIMEVVKNGLQRVKESERQFSYQ